MGLSVLDHLQTVFETAQKPIVVDQIAGGSGIDASHRGKAVERLASRRHPERGHAAAPDQLLRLRKELDFADPAAANLDVVAFDGYSSATAMGVDLALDRMDVLNRRKV